ncbi:hypothetical protein KKB40_03865, partial [Patescibacteria group bacterium]|nr:hypothetical protein [Patescibacteria group bacterium]
STVYFDDVSVKEVTHIGTDGVHIMSTKGGSTQNWAGISADFDYNDSAYTFEIRKTDFQITGDMSVGAWVKSTSTNWVRIIDKSDCQAGACGVYSTLLLGFEGGTGKLLFATNDNPAGTNETIKSNAAFNDGQWHYVVGVYNASGDSRSIYVNGEFHDELINSKIFDDSFGPLSIGARYAGIPDAYFNGLIDEPFITAEALTADQIQTMFETGCRAMGGTPGTGTCTGIDEDSTDNTLAGSQNAVYGVGGSFADAQDDSAHIYVGTSGGGTGALTKLQINADKQLDSWTTGTSLALLSNNISGGIGVIGGSGVIGVGTDSGFSLLSSSYAGIGGLISGTSGGTTYGFDVGSTTHVIDSFSSSETGSGTVTNYLRGGSNEAMTTGITPWYEVSSGGDTTVPIALDTSRYYQYKSIVEPSSDGASSPTVSSLTMNYSTLPTAPSGLAHNSSATTATSITWTWTDNSNNEDGFYVKDADGNTVCTAAEVNAVSCQETGLSEYTSYTRKVVSYNSAGNSSDSDTASVYTSDVTVPDTFELANPGSNNYINEERPIFRWKVATDTSGSGIASYNLSIDNGDTGDFGITGIPATGTEDYEGDSKYVASYENGYVSVYFRSSSDWGSSENDGKLKEGKRVWTVTAVDSQGNEKDVLGTVFVDRTSPTLGSVRVNDASVPPSEESPQATSEEGLTAFVTSDTTPSFSGSLSDALSGDVSTDSGENHKVAGGPKEVEIKVEKKGLFGIYSLHTISIISFTDIYWGDDHTKITDNTAQINPVTGAQESKYANFLYTLSELPLGEYKVTISGKDQAGNTARASFSLGITAIDELLTSEEQETIRQVIEEELPRLTDEEKEEKAEEIKDELEITKQIESKTPSIVEKIVPKIVNLVKTIYWKAVDGGKSVINMLAAIGKKQADFTSSIAKAGVNFTGKMLRWAGRATKTALAWNMRYSDSVVKVSTKTIRLAMSAVSSAKNAVVASYNILAQRAPGVIGDGMVAIGNIAESIVGKTASIATKLSVNFSETISYSIKIVASATENGFLAMTTNISNTGSAIASVVGSTTKSIASKVITPTKEFTHNTKVKILAISEILFDKEPTRITEVKVVETGKDYAVILWKTNHHTKNNKVNYGEDQSY